MKFFILLLALLFTTVSFANDDCKITIEERKTLMFLSLVQFDQNQGGGWRELADKGCYVLAVELIEEYLALHHKDMEEWQTEVLHWHAGQCHAFSNEYFKAIKKFESTINPDEPEDDPFKWNAYVRGSIAFLKKEKGDSRTSISDLEKATSPYAVVNLKIPRHCLMTEEMLSEYSRGATMLDFIFK